ncbi:hypothetical protein HJG54_08110 [Leptolyngbya sp. NK1-12]|uniref:Uncharacterized protein n=1 Tax=Leptolyngbya sp. NK1-12 TaxID=2547451 RepID=A0AA96WCQ7_9CYAN|nr:hypothetical protein [Leptolyngbya sp. NK1-12]WNZ22823.1 hypothetical protein HJG54_08110 [Leptolyngbya sp. NK1-12]
MNDFVETPVEYPVSIWEGVAITAGAVLLVIAGLAGLGIKALGNAFDAERAEAIAQSLMTYEIPGGSRGFFGTNIGGGKMAVVTSIATVTPATSPGASPQSPQSIPTVELFLARMPLVAPETATEEPNPSPEPRNELFSGFSFSFQDPATFQVNEARTEEKPVCGMITPVEIQQGSLTVASDAAPLPAVKYEAKRVLDDESHIVVISALGDRAAEQANQVFNSLVCQ